MKKKNTMSAEQEAEWRVQHAEVMARVEKSRQEEPVLQSGPERDPKTWDATYPAHMRRRHNLGGRY